MNQKPTTKGQKMNAGKRLITLRDQIPDIAAACAWEMSKAQSACDTINEIIQERAALLAVAEAAKPLVARGCYGPRYLQLEKLNTALATLAQIQKGE